MPPRSRASWAPPMSPAVFADADRIVPADSDFDRLPGLTRLDPANLREWSDSLVAREDG